MFRVNRSHVGVEQHAVKVASTTDFRLSNLVENYFFLAQFEWAPDSFHTGEQCGLPELGAHWDHGAHWDQELRISGHHSTLTYGTTNERTLVGCHLVHGQP
jgi:hypothetical protein